MPLGFADPIRPVDTLECAASLLDEEAETHDVVWEYGVGFCFGCGVGHDVVTVFACELFEIKDMSGCGHE